MNAVTRIRGTRNQGLFGGVVHSAVLGLSLALATALAAPTASHAQSSSGSASGATGSPIKATGKGITGLGLIGLELGMVIPALAGARDTWEFIVFPAIGAGGGAVAGYFLLEKGSGHPEVAVATLVAGMALLVPALVVTLSETAYEADEDQAAALHPQLAGLGVPRKVAQAAAAGPGLVRVSEQGVFVAPPVLTLASNVSEREALRTGVPRERVLQAPLLSGTF